MNTQQIQSKKSITPAQALLQKEVTRKEFIATSGLAIVSILGFSTIIHFLTGHGNGRPIVASSKQSGYGSSSYGR